MRHFSFSMNPVLRLPWGFFLFICVIGIIWGGIIQDKDVILPSLVGFLIFAIFFSMKRFSSIIVNDRSLKIKLGFIANCELPLSIIKSTSIVVHKAISGIGVRACSGGETAIVTKTGEVVRLELKKKSYLKLFKIFKITFNSLRLSPEKQSEFMQIIETNIPTNNS